MESGCPKGIAWALVLEATAAAVVWLLIELYRFL